MQEMWTWSWWLRPKLRFTSGQIKVSKSYTNFKSVSWEENWKQSGTQEEIYEQLQILQTWL